MKSGPVAALFAVVGTMVGTIVGGWNLCTVISPGCQKANADGPLGNFLGPCRVSLARFFVHLMPCEFTAGTAGGIWRNADQPHRYFVARG